MSNRLLNRLSLCVLVTSVVAPSFAADVNGTTAVPSTETSAVNPLVNGRKIYQRYCSVCHGTKGEGGMGPVLKGAFVEKGRNFVVAQITKPQGAMPQMYPSPIDDKALADLLLFLEKMK